MQLLAKVLPKVTMWRLESDSNLRPSMHARPTGPTQTDHYRPVSNLHCTVDTKPCLRFQKRRLSSCGGRSCSSWENSCRTGLDWLGSESWRSPDPIHRSRTSLTYRFKRILWCLVKGRLVNGRLIKDGWSKDDWSSTPPTKKQRETLWNILNCIPSQLSLDPPNVFINRRVVYAAFMTSLFACFLEYVLYNLIVSFLNSAA